MEFSEFPSWFFKLLIYRNSIDFCLLVLYVVVFLSLFFFFANYSRCVYLFVCLFLPYHVACGILVLPTGIEPGPLTVEVWSPNHWTTGNFLGCFMYSNISFFRRDGFPSFAVGIDYMCFSYIYMFLVGISVVFLLEVVQTSLLHSWS